MNTPASLSLTHRLSMTHRLPINAGSVRRSISVFLVLIGVGVLAAQARTRHTFSDQIPLTSEQLALIKKAMVQERAIMQAVRSHSPLVETYVQTMKKDPVVDLVPTSDNFMLSRVDFAKVFTANSYGANDQASGFFQGSAKAFSTLGKLFKVNYSPAGFMDMMFVDPSGFTLKNYDFRYVGRQFLGEVKTSVFDVMPKNDRRNGMFIGRIWIEDQGGNIVRFNGTYTHDSLAFPGKYWMQFDSWRANLQPGVWLPVAIYAQEDEPQGSKNPGFRAQTHFWGYSLKLPVRTSSNTSVRIDNVINESKQSQDLSPLQAQHAWQNQAAQNVLERLVQAGLLAPPSDFDKVLEQITNNIIIGNNLQLRGNIDCRVLLTMPLETASVGDTILISKGLVDVLPSEADLAAMLSFQLAQIALGHQIDMRYAFEDRLLFPDEATFQQITLGHNAADNASAATKAIELLEHSVYRDRLSQVGLFLTEIQSKAGSLKALMTPQLGDSLLNAQGVPWMSGVWKGEVKIQPTNLSQIPALPLGSHLKIDPWDDKVIFMHTAPSIILTAADKMPLEIGPVYFRLRRYQASVAPDVAAGAKPAGQSAAQADPQTKSNP